MTQSNESLHLRPITIDDLVHRYGSTPSWWTRHRSRLVEQGYLFKKGRVFFGDLDAIQNYLTGGDQ